MSKENPESAPHPPVVLDSAALISNCRSKDEKLNLRLAISARNTKKVADYRAWLDVQVEGTGITVHSEVISLGGGAPAVSAPISVYLCA